MEIVFLATDPFARATLDVTVVACLLGGRKKFEAWWGKKSVLVECYILCWFGLGD